jgi:hypothetical protein
LHYRKIKPLDVASLAVIYADSGLITDADRAQGYNPFDVTSCQPYSPLYKEFFVLNDSNYNRVGLNHPRPFDPAAPDTPFFVKSAPLVDVFGFLNGSHATAEQLAMLRTLPTLANESACDPKVLNKHNAAYVDGFFCYLSSQLLHTHNVFNALDFFGSYLALQKQFKCNVTAELEHLLRNDFFQTHLGSMFKLSSDLSLVEENWSRSHRKPLQIMSLSDVSVGLDVHAVDDVEAAETAVVLSSSSSSSSVHSVEDADLVCDADLSLLDKEEKVILKRPGVEYDSDIDTVFTEDEDEDEDDDDDEDQDGDNSEEDSEEDQDGDDSEEDSEEDQDGDDEDDEDISEYVYIDNFPANLIFLEKCEGTLTSLFFAKALTEESATAALMQVIMALLAFQKTFHFSHNDLHSDNIMYVKTDAEYVFYKYNDHFYRVPTYGYLFKIIDFGRATFQYAGQLYASDCFAPNGDAFLQYNTEPFFDPNKRRVEVNFSFDLCRLGCSLFDVVFPYETPETLTPFQETIYRWCLDDQGKHMLYRPNGEDRYEGFKLYRMIARNVHAHTPQKQLNFPLFQQFRMDVAAAAQLDVATVRKYGTNLDALPDYAHAT